jgi:hypothetical protein
MAAALSVAASSAAPHGHTAIGARFRSSALADANVSFRWNWTFSADGVNDQILSVADRQFDLPVN